MSYQTKGWFVVIFGFLGTLIWSSFYEIDQGLPAFGYVIPKVEKISIIAPSNGIVTAIHSESGNLVQTNQTLMEFDSKAIESSINSHSESISGLVKVNAILVKASTSRKQQITALKLQHSSMSNLVNSGFASLSALATIQSQLSLAESEGLELDSRVEQNLSKLKELKEQKDGFIHQLKLLKIRAPLTGYLMNLSVKSPGVHITAGTLLAELVPASDELIIEVRIPVELGDRILVGQRVDIMFPSLPGNATQHTSGNLYYLSADKMTDSRTNQTYLDARVSFDALELVHLKGLRVGLPASIIISTGPRTMLSYLTRPFSERMSMGLQ